MYDSVIIGAGVTGCAVARFLSMYRGKFCVLERAEDVCTGTSKANSAIIHAGFDAAHGSLMAKYNLLGNRMYPELAKELDFSYINNGSLVLALGEEDIPKLEALMENGRKNGVEGLEIVGRERLKELEPSVGHVPVAALYAPTAGIVCPFGATIAFAENAFENGVEFRFNDEVKGVTPSSDEEGKPCWVVQTAEGSIRTRTVVNAAGVYSDIIHNMVSADKIKIVPRKGDYLLLDRRTGGYVKHTVFQVPGKYGKGVLVSPTVHGNTIIGPTAEDIDDKEGVDTTSEGFDDLMEKAGLAFDDLPLREVITSSGCAPMKPDMILYWEKYRMHRASLTAPGLNLRALRQLRPSERKRPRRLRQSLAFLQIRILSRRGKDLRIRKRFPSRTWRPS